jgi:hypothetical protein
MGHPIIGSRDKLLVLGMERFFSKGTRAYREESPAAIRRGTERDEAGLK